MKAQIEELDNEYQKAIVAGRMLALAGPDGRSGTGPMNDGSPAPGGNGRVIDRMTDQPHASSLLGLRGITGTRRDLKAMNAVKLTTEGVLVPTRYGTDLMPAWNEVSSIIDLVRIFPRIGGEAFERSYGARIWRRPRRLTMPTTTNPTQNSELCGSAVQNHGLYGRGRGRAQAAGHRL